MTGFSFIPATGKGRDRRPRAASSACGLLILVCVAGLARAEGSWHWLDDHGRKVYSDLPPPVTVPEHRIVQRPGSVSLPVDRPAGTDPSSGSQGSPASGGDRAAEAVRQSPAERPLYQRNADTLRDNCRRARAALQTLNSELRLRIINERGEAVVLDDALRAQEIRRMQQEERDNCVPERKASKP